MAESHPTSRREKRPFRIDLAGRRFGRLAVRQYAGRAASSHSLWLCDCDCGTEHVTQSISLTSGSAKSCGCLRNEKSRQRLTTHGLSTSPEHNCWCHINGRCGNPANRAYHLYGGRGIRVCERWRGSFEDFLADMGRRPPELTSIDRINVDGHYSCGRCDECRTNGWPANCQWATDRTQAGNRRANVRITYDGETLILQDWGRRFGISATVLAGRLRYGWDFLKAATTPVHPANRSLTFRGVTKTTVEWAAATGIKRALILFRINQYGWTVERALTTPARQFSCKETA